MTNKLCWGVQLTSIRILSRSPMKTKKHGVDSAWTFQLSTALSYLWRSLMTFRKENFEDLQFDGGYLPIWYLRIECRLYPSNSGKWSKAPRNASANLGTRTLNGILTCMQRCLRGSIPGAFELVFARFPFNLKGLLLFWKSGDCDL